MCGIIGYYGRPRKGTSLEAGLACLSHRGPDDHGTYFAEAGDRSVGLGHARLSIIDLSLQGHQPMRSADGKRQIVFNGEIYNYRALRGELESEGCTFRSHSDTEVLLEGYGRWGDGVLHRLRGMFAFAIWEEDTRTLFLARDRLGVKPLYVAQTPDGLWFSSEVRALLAAGAVPRRLSIPGVSSYLHFGSVAGPLTIIEGVTELGAGTSVRFDGENSVARTYWSLPVFHGHRPEEELRIDPP